MSTESKKYRLGNQPEQYELSENYLGWIPEGLGCWENFYHEYWLKDVPKTITLIQRNGEEKVTLNLHQRFSKDAFPLNFFGEARAAEWGNFLMVSKTDEPETKFIIPMH